MKDKKKVKMIVASAVALAIAVASYFGVSAPPGLAQPATELICSVSGWC